MRKMVITIGALCLIIFCLAACTAAPPPVTIDPAAIDANLMTDPESSIAGSPIKLKAEFTGAVLSKSSSMTFEVRVNEEPEFVEAEYEGQNIFSGTYTFLEAGTYEVYLHLYTNDIHLTKKKQVVVQ